MKETLLVFWALFCLPLLVYWISATRFWDGGTPAYYAGMVHAVGLAPLLLAAVVKK